MSAATAPPSGLFTCITCSIAFTQPDEQRTHFRSEFHRYNMKRRLADLLPIKAQQFADKVAEHETQAQHAAQHAAEQAGRCDVCRKSFASQNAYLGHLRSKKHRDNMRKPLDMSSVARSLPKEARGEKEDDEDDGDLDEESAAERKIARARRIDPAHECIFCGAAQVDLDGSVAHMSHEHGFFVPEKKYLVDLRGLMQYLADKVSVGNICLWCNGRGRGFHELTAVRKHMLDKSHCKVAYEANEDQLELADFYDFRPSYPDYQQKVAEADAWEDDDDAEDGGDAVWEGESDDELPADNGIRFGDSELELVLPSGARLGHRSLRHYYRQTLWQTPASREAPPSATNARALAHRLAGDRTQSLVVPNRGGHELKARNRGEAREATRHVREFRDQKKKELFRTKVGFKHNHQKHYRDALLQ